MKIKKILPLFLAFSFLPTLVSAQETAKQPGSKVRVEMRGADGKTREIPLYAGSHALVIGNSDYDYWQRLPGAKEDVAEVSKALAANGFSVETAENLDSENLPKRIDKFIRDYGYDAEQRLLIYYAGHGDTQKAVDTRDLGFIIPTDAPLFKDNQKGYFQKAVSMDKIDNWARQIQTRHVLFVFDSCFSGKLVTRNEPVLPDIIKEAAAHNGRQFITSGAANQTVSDGSEFRKTFVAGLNGDADYNADGYVTATELAAFLRDRIINLTRRRQTPQYGTISDPDLSQGDMIFPLPPERRINNEIAAQKLLEATPQNDPDANMRLVNLYPNTKPAEIARERLKLMNQSVASRGSASLAAEDVKNLLTGGIFDFLTVSLNYRGAEGVKETKTAKFVEEDLGGAVKLRLAEIPAGKFKMGSLEFDQEKPVREVGVENFYIGSLEVTQAQWRRVTLMPKVKIDLLPSPSSFTGDLLPVENITWEEAQEFCVRLSRQTGRDYSLPSEAEWEYAARANSTLKFAFGERISAQLVNFNAATNSPLGLGGVNRKETVEAGSLKFANNFGLYDMHGNVAEWCADVWQKDYTGAALTADARDGDSKRRVVRGGSYSSPASDVRLTARTLYPQDEGNERIGFRVVLRIKTER